MAWKWSGLHDEAQKKATGGRVRLSAPGSKSASGSGGSAAKTATHLPAGGAVGSGQVE